MSARLAASRETCARAKEEIVFRPSYRDPKTGRFVSCSPQAQARLATAAPNPPPRTELYPRVVAVEGRKRADHESCNARCARNGHLFRHDFTSKNPIVGLPDGSILIPSNGRRLWGWA